MEPRSNSVKERYPLFEIKARKQHPQSSHVECERQNNELSESMKFALSYISQFPGHTARDLEKIAGCEPGKIWKVAAQLERRGLIKRVQENKEPYKLYLIERK